MRSPDLCEEHRNRFTIAPGRDGTPLPTDNGIYLNDIGGLMLHEIGHALGLGHLIYGPAAVPVPISPAAWVVLGILLAAVGARESIRPRIPRAR